LPGLLRPALEAVADLPRLHLSAAAVAAVVQGRSLAPGDWAGPPAPAGEVALIGPDGALVAVAEGVPAAGRVLPRRVLAGG
jgi:tRNA pseudouridine55 synthase